MLVNTYFLANKHVSKLAVIKQIYIHRTVYHINANFYTFYSLWIFQDLSPPFLYILYHHNQNCQGYFSTLIPTIFAAILMPFINQISCQIIIIITIITLANTVPNRRHSTHISPISHHYYLAIITVSPVDKIKRSLFPYILYNRRYCVR